MESNTFLLEHALCELGVYVDMRSLTTTCCPLTKSLLQPLWAWKMAC